MRDVLSSHQEQSSATLLQTPAGGTAPHIHTHRDTCTDTDTDTHAQAQTHTYIHRHMHRATDTHRHMHRATDTDRHTRTDTDTHRHTCKQLIPILTLYWRPTCTSLDVVTVKLSRFTLAAAHSEFHQQKSNDDDNNDDHQLIIITNSHKLASACKLKTHNYSVSYRAD